MKFQIALLLCLSILLQTCKSTKKAAESNDYHEIIIDDSFRKPINDKAIFASTADAVALDTVFLTKDTLHIFTRKIQGCETDEFKLIWNGGMAKSIPPIIGLKLLQTADPSCREKHKFRLAYNIAPLKMNKDTTSGLGTVLKIGGWKEAVKYK
jgi:hypothetical protein